MKGQLIFRIFVDISSYLYEFCILMDFIIRSISFVVNAVPLRYRDGHL